MRKSLIGLAAGAVAVSGLLTGMAQAMPGGTLPELRPDQKAFFGLYKELVETNTTVTHGSCTEAAAKMAARLKAAGMTDDQLIPAGSSRSIRAPMPA